MNGSIDQRLREVSPVQTSRAYEDDNQHGAGFVVRRIALGLIVLYCTVKPNLDYMIGYDSIFSRMVMPLVTWLHETPYDGDTEREWQYLLQKNREAIVRTDIAEIIKHL